VPGIEISKCESNQRGHGRDNLGHAAAGRSRMTLFGIIWFRYAAAAISHRRGIPNPCRDWLRFSPAPRGGPPCSSQRRCRAFVSTSLLIQSRPNSETRRHILPSYDQLVQHALRELFIAGRLRWPDNRIAKLLRGRQRGVCSGRIAGVHRQHGAGDIAAALAQEIFHHGRDIVGFGQPAQRAAPSDALARIVGEALR
jgi:hypothetical protein